MPVQTVFHVFPLAIYLYYTYGLLNLLNHIKTHIEEDIGIAIQIFEFFLKWGRAWFMYIECII